MNEGKCANLYARNEELHIALGKDMLHLESLDTLFHITRFIQSVRVDGYLHVHLIADAEGGVDCRRSRPPVFVELQPLD